MWDIGFWFALVVGFIGNILAIFTITSLPKSTSTFYVGLLAVSDLCALCIRGSIDVLSEHEVITPELHYSNLVAMVFDYCASYSNWLLVLIGLERLLTMRFPLQKRSILTLRRAQLSAVVLAIALLIPYGLAVRTLDYLDAQVFGVRNLLYAVLPLAFNSVIIILISSQLRRAQRARKKILTSHSQPRSVLVVTPSSGSTGGSRKTSTVALAPGTPAPCGVTSPQRQPNTLQTIAHLENSITVMMLVAAICFFLLTFPNCVLLYSYEYVARAVRNAPVLRARWLFLSRVTELLTFLNLSVNFVLYFLSAKKFRSHLYRVLTPRSWSVRSGNMGGNFYSNSHNNSVSVFRAIQLYGSEKIPLKHRDFTVREIRSAGATAVVDEAADVVSAEASHSETIQRSDHVDSVIHSQPSLAVGCDGAGTDASKKPSARCWLDTLAGQNTPPTNGALCTHPGDVKDDKLMSMTVEIQGLSGEAL